MEQDSEARNKTMPICLIDLWQSRQEHSMGVKIVYSINGVGKTGTIHAKRKEKKLGHLLTWHTRINPEWIKDLHLRL